MKSPDQMTPGEINRELDRLDAKRSKLCDALIAAGRGHETSTETCQKDDPLSAAWREVCDRLDALQREIHARCGPGRIYRMPKGFGPIGKSTRRRK